MDNGTLALHPYMTVHSIDNPFDILVFGLLSIDMDVTISSID